MRRFYASFNANMLIIIKITVDESYTLAPWLAHLPGKQKVPGLNHGGAA